MHASLAPRSKVENPSATYDCVKLVDLDLSKELYEQYVYVKQMLTDADDEPLNQRAQTVNAVVGVLARITTIRTELYSAERLKKLESCLVATLKEFPEMQAHFMAAYEEAINVQ